MRWRILCFFSFFFPRNITMIVQLPSRSFPFPSCWVAWEKNTRQEVIFYNLFLFFLPFPLRRRWLCPSLPLSSMRCWKKGGGGQACFVPSLFFFSSPYPTLLAVPASAKKFFSFFFPPPKKRKGDNYLRLVGPLLSLFLFLFFPLLHVPFGRR